MTAEVVSLEKSAFLALEVMFSTANLFDFKPVYD